MHAGYVLHASDRTELSFKRVGQVHVLDEIGDMRIAGTERAILGLVSVPLDKTLDHLQVVHI